jgi:hypothetical protein
VKSPASNDSRIRAVEHFRRFNPLLRSELHQKQKFRGRAWGLHDGKFSVTGCKRIRHCVVVREDEKPGIRGLLLFVNRQTLLALGASAKERRNPSADAHGKPMSGGEPLFIGTSWSWAIRYRPSLVRRAVLSPKERRNPSAEAHGKPMSGGEPLLIVRSWARAIRYRPSLVLGVAYTQGSIRHVAPDPRPSRCSSSPRRDSEIQREESHRRKQRERRGFAPGMHGPFTWRMGWVKETLFNSSI